jgi:glycosyltransferase involved in cell wall biosynthesis
MNHEKRVRSLKILFLVQDETMASSRIRVMNLVPELEKEGIRAYVLEYPKKLMEKLSMIKTCRQYDVTFLQKKLPSHFDAILLKIYSNKLVFDFDDAIYYRHDARESLSSATRNKKFVFLTRRADLVIAGNRILADHAGRCNRNVVVIPSAVETRDLPVKNYDLAPDRIAVGWVGGKVNLHHLEMLSPIFQRLSGEYPIEVRILSDDAISIPSVDVRFIPWRLDTQEREIALFDIGVMPLPNNRHTEGKCGYKALQYMAVAVPPVVSDVGVNGDIVEDGREGFVARNREAFYEALKKLIEDRTLRKKMGLNARRKVERLYSIGVVGKKLADELKEIGR